VGRLGREGVSGVEREKRPTIIGGTVVWLRDE